MLKNARALLTLTSSTLERELVGSMLCCLLCFLFPFSVDWSRMVVGGADLHIVCTAYE